MTHTIEIDSLPYTLTTAHAASSYNQPVLVDSDGTAYGPVDLLPNGYTAGDALFYLASGFADVSTYQATLKFRGLPPATEQQLYAAGFDKLR